MLRGGRVASFRPDRRATGTGTNRRTWLDESVTNGEGTDREPARLCLVFAAGHRPTWAEVAAVVDTWPGTSISHGIAQTAPGESGSSDDADLADGKAAAGPGGGMNGEEGEWVELVRDGLTFDLTGLAPRPPSTFPLVAHPFDLPRIPDAARFEVVDLALGGHLTGGARMIPVAKGLIALARDFVHRFDHLEAVTWSPARSAMGHRYFESVATAWLDGGPFPAFGLTAFRDNGERGLETEGLSYWVERELQLEPALCQNPVQAKRMAARIVDHLVHAGRLDADERLSGPTAPISS